MRIVLLTGQPGYNPQRTVVEHYEINNYLLTARFNCRQAIHAGLRWAAYP